MPLQKKLYMEKNYIISNTQREEIDVFFEWVYTLLKPPLFPPTLVKVLVGADLSYIGIFVVHAHTHACTHTP